MNKDEIRKKFRHIAEKRWEISNKQLYEWGGINPHAYELGFYSALAAILESGKISEKQLVEAIESL